MHPLMGRKTVSKFKEIFPIWAPRVAKWRPSGLFTVKIWLTDGNIFLFTYTGKSTKLIVANEGKMKGKIVYDSKTDGRRIV